jgi:uncharacterized Ntn-hydrolase superfamily protein
MIPVTKNVADPLAEWKRMVEDRQDLVTDPDGQRTKLRELAMLAYQRYQVDADELSDMLEVTDAAREWGLMELEEGYNLGIFDNREFGPQTGTQYFDGKQLVRAG